MGWCSAASFACMCRFFAPPPAAFTGNTPAHILHPEILQLGVQNGAKSPEEESGAARNRVSPTVRTRGDSEPCAGLQAVQGPVLGCARTGITAVGNNRNTQWPQAAAQCEPHTAATRNTLFPAGGEKRTRRGGCVHPVCPVHPPLPHKTLTVPTVPTAH